MTPQELAAISNTIRARRSITPGSYASVTTDPNNTMGTKATPADMAAAIAAVRANVNGLPNDKQAVPSTLAPPPLGSDPNLLAAFDAMMQDQAQGDAETGSLRRNLQDSLDLSQKERLHNILMAHQSFADRGTLNSGVALHNDEDVNTLYDQQQRAFENNTQDSIQGIARRHLGKVTDYNNAGIRSSHDAEVARADAAAAKLKADNEAATSQDQIAQLLAQLSPAASAYVPPPESPIWTPVAKPPVAYKPPVVKPVYKPPVIKSPIAKLTLKGPK